MKRLLAVLMLPILAGLSTAAGKPVEPAPVKIEQADKLIADGIQLLDVRTKEEWDEGCLKGTKCISIGDKDFVKKATAELDPKKPVLVYCHIGGRSARAVKQLRAAGFTTVYDLAGGITAWKKADKPVEKPVEKPERK
jgi:rhodanese-related sulfurtransferase